MHCPVVGMEIARFCKYSGRMALKWNPTCSKGRDSYGAVFVIARRPHVERVECTYMKVKHREGLSEITVTHSQLALSACSDKMEIS